MDNDIERSDAEKSFFSDWPTEKLEDVETYLADLESNPGYITMMMALEIERKTCLEALPHIEDNVRLRNAQGFVRGISEVLGVRSLLIKSIRKEIEERNDDDVDVTPKRPLGDNGL